MDRKTFITNGSLFSLAPFVGVHALFNLSGVEAKPKKASPDLSNSYWFVASLISVLMSSKDTENKFSLLRYVERRGMEPPPHTHTREDESFYLLDGEVDYYVGDEVLRAKKGDWVFLPKNIQHSFKVQTETADTLILFNPGGFENYFIEVASRAKELGLPPIPKDPPDSKKLLEVAARYGLTYPKK
jgi:quercetin dioxygenase-like cupin family protein